MGCVHLLSQDWWENVKNELEKSSFDEKRMGIMYEEMRSSLGDPARDGHGMFRKKFIQVCGFLLQTYREIPKLYMYILCGDVRVVQCNRLIHHTINLSEPS